MPIDLDKDQDIYVTRGMVRAEFDFWVGEPMDKFFDGLENKKLTGNKCNKCGKVFVPPRKRCGDCFAKTEKYIELPEYGVLKNFTVTPYKISERRTRKSRSKRMVGLINIEGADTGMTLPIINTDPEDLKMDMKMQIVWNDKCSGHPSDIDGIEPRGGE
ncbi:MAG: Zn-ribbon domain-containing OB-fold protein [Promethearchaeia archaeon]